MRGVLDHSAGLFENAPAQEPVQATLRHHVHLASEKLLEVGDQRRMIEQCPPRLELDQKIDVAPFPRIPARRGPEHANVARAVFGGDAQDLFPLLL